MRLLILLTVALLGGCALDCPKPPPPQPRIIDTACSWVTQMTASASDTPETKREVIAYEKARRANCPGVTP